MKRMRYYCNYCKSEITSDADWRRHKEDCPICRYDRDYVRSLFKIPDCETPEQYEKRTGKKWNGAGNALMLEAVENEDFGKEIEEEEEEINPFKGSEDERNCRCNNCGARFKEGEIRIANGGKEFCPSCGVPGCIADEQQEDEE